MQHPCGVFHHNSWLQKSWPRLCTLRQTSTAHVRRWLHHGASHTPWCLTLASSVDLFDSWASASATTWHTTTWHTSFWHATAPCCLVYLHHDGVNNTFNLFLLGLEFILFGQLVLVKPIQSVLHCSFNLFLVSTLELVLQLVVRKRVPHLEAIVLQAVLRLDLLLVLLFFSTVLLCLLDHPVDL